MTKFDRVNWKIRPNKWQTLNFTYFHSLMFAIHSVFLFTLESITAQWLHASQKRANKHTNIERRWWRRGKKKKTVLFVKNSHSGALYNNSHLNGILTTMKPHETAKWKKQPHKTLEIRDIDEWINFFIFYYFFLNSIQIWWGTVFWCTLWCLQHHNHHQHSLIHMLMMLFDFHLRNTISAHDYISGAKEKWMHKMSA